MKYLVVTAALVVLSSFGGKAQAETVRAGGITVEKAWSRATPPGARAAAIYMLLTNRGTEAVSVVSLSTDVASMTEAHQTINEDGMMRMRPAENLLIAVGDSLVFEPGGLHVMLMGLQRQLSAGDTFTLQITLSDGQQLETEVLVGNPGQMTMP
ncbi:MAG: copper chaperone PCu(A)C [Pseudomonadota bacterium]